MKENNQNGLYNPMFEKDACGVGFVADLQARSSHQMVTDALEVLSSMTHRGGIGSEPNSGDGAGILTALPHDFLGRVARSELGREFPGRGESAAGLVFLPQDQTQRDECKARVESAVSKLGQVVLGWRAVPTDAGKADLGPSARASEPVIEQLLVAAGPGYSGLSFEQQLYVVRKWVTREIRNSSLSQASMFYICSLSSKVIVYKGQLLAEQLLPYFPDLSDPDFKSPLGMVHSRFSTNTFPSWDRAQPNRFSCHNGEINTLRGNINWMKAREGLLHSEAFGENLKRLLPVAEPDSSDSGNLDNVLEFLTLNGRSLPEAISMMVPEAWQGHQSMSPEKRAYYEFQSCLMEPWDGPASILFSDGDCIGAVLDRNGLRPGRYYLTFDDRMLFASEVGVLPIDPAQVRQKGRLQPGRILLVDLKAGRIISDQEIKSDLAKARPYRKWLDNQTLKLSQLAPGPIKSNSGSSVLPRRLKAFGFTVETFDFFLLPLVKQGRDPVGSMGNDSALACLSDQPRLIYDYFKQLFAQVTNPAIDSIREELIMSLRCYVGPEGNLLDSRASQAKRLEIPHPILSNEELSSLEALNEGDWKSRTIDITWSAVEGKTGMVSSLDRICTEAESAIREGLQLIILSDRRAGEDRVPLSSLLAVGAVHQHLVAKSMRTQIGIVLETGEARAVHHHCLLIGYGADAINPYLAYEALWKVQSEGRLEGFEDRTAVVEAYRKAVAKGILKVLAKMGISTLQSYKGAQIFEAVGLNREVMDRCFTGSASRIKGVGFNCLAQESLLRFRQGYPEHGVPETQTLSNPGDIHWRAGGEQHAWSPSAIAHLQTAARTDNREAYRQYAELLNDGANRTTTLRGLLSLDSAHGLGPIRLDQVEDASRIVRRFCTGAMSFGSISAETHETLAVAMNRMKGRSNTGEGGEDPRRFRPLPNGDSKRSAIKQVASGRFGVTLSYLVNADELQIKIAQGAKPGEGGELPGHKVDEIIAKTRYSTPGVGLISPPPHHDIYSIEDLKQLIYDLRNANPNARISVKLVAEVGVGTIAAGVAKAHADHIVISGHDGGTGASPITSIKHAGLPWELGLAETHQTLVLNDLRSRVCLQTDGGLKTGRDVVIAALLGAEEFAFSTAPLVSLGCIMMRKCHLNTCPVGIATQDPILRERFQGTPEHVINFLFLVAEEAREWMAKLGFRTVNEMIGRSDVLRTRLPEGDCKACRVDLSSVIQPAWKMNPGASTRRTSFQEAGLDQALDKELLNHCRERISNGQPVRLDSEVKNVHRTVGTLLSSYLVQQWGEEGLPDDSVHLKLNGSAGQSLGAWLAKGVTIELEGDANDYVGKGLSGGRLVLYPPRESRFRAEQNIIAGNVVLYGATSGEAYFRGRAAERFGVRNSGASAVVEGIGDHGCEYMTGGTVVILGPAGRNFAAGMSGGVAYVWDPEGRFYRNCNLGMVDLDPITTEAESRELHHLIQNHFEYTKSSVAREILSRWPEALSEFVKVMPVDYKRVLRQREQAKTGEEAA